MKINVNYRGYLVSFECDEETKVSDIIVCIASLTDYIVPIDNISLIVIPRKYTGKINDDVLLTKTGCIDGERVGLMVEGMTECVTKKFENQWIDLEKHYGLDESEDVNRRIRKLEESNFRDNIQIMEDLLDLARNNMEVMDDLMNTVEMNQTNGGKTKETDKEKQKMIKKERKLVKHTKLQRIKKQLEINMVH